MILQVIKNLAEVAEFLGLEMSLGCSDGFSLMIRILQSGDTFRVAVRE